MFEKYIDNSPYQYTLNNPINFIDIDGQQLNDVDDGILKAIGALPITGGAISIIEASTVAVGSALAITAITGVYLGDLTYSTIIDKPSTSLPFPISDPISFSESLPILTIPTGYEEGIATFKIIPDQYILPGSERVDLPFLILPMSKNGRRDIFSTIFDPIKTPIIEAIKKGINRKEVVESAKKWAKEKGLDNATEKEYDLLSKFIRDKLKKK